MVVRVGRTELATQVAVLRCLSLTFPAHGSRPANGIQRQQGMHCSCSGATAAKQTGIWKCDVAPLLRPLFVPASTYF